MTNQEVYDKVKAHLLTQKTKSYSKSLGICVYKMARSTKKCAVGCLLPDDLYEKSMEGTAVENLLRGYPKVKKLFTGVDVSLLDALQTIHDKEPVKKWPHQLEVVATVYGLNP